MDHIFHHHNFVKATSTTTNIKMQDNKFTIILVVFIGLVVIEATPINETICKGIPSSVIVLLPHPENCSLFIECANEVPVVFECPYGLHWNAQLRECDFPEAANCKINKAIIPTPMNNKKWTNCDGVPENTDVLLPNPNNCDTYIQCVHQKPVVRACPPGLQWNSVSSRCDWPESANCNVNICEGVPETENVLLPNPDDCGTFIQCVHQKPVVRQCPLGLEWNAAKETCDWPNSAKCIAPATRTKTVDGANKWTNCNGVPENQDVLLPNPKNCDSYIQCVHQKPVVRPCPPNLHWNAAKNVCDWPQFANCKRNTCEGVPETENVLLPNPEDCGTFIQCVHQIPIVQSCPVGLHWSAATNRCDWPNIAKCNVLVNP